MKKPVLLTVTISWMTLLCAITSHAQTVIPLWKNGAPGFEARRNEPEVAKDYYVRNIHNPSLTVFLPPADKANGAAVIVCPGGGHRLLVYNSEGVEPAKFYNSLGITVFVLKYRLGRDTLSPYNVDIHPRQDALRAMRLVRSKAAKYHLDTARIGIMGFSAGGEVVDMVAFNNNAANPAAKDPVDRLSAKPDFIVQVYPGPGYVPETIPANAPPAFLVAANDDACCSLPIIKLLQAYREAKVPVEMHMYAKGDHAFNMGKNRNLVSINNWPQRLADWLQDSHILQPETKKVMH
ncbi:alpha/beta hydrolase [Mucilaginibacter litoreus]|uniref:Alpha/beta hydrolase n=1 Tax=Mucilaginibacter litoreus TaxID=1048221 RepID=A0ABW3ARA2_9SPHI